MAREFAAEDHGESVVDDAGRRPAGTSDADDEPIDGIVETSVDGARIETDVAGEGVTERVKAMLGWDDATGEGTAW